MPKKFSLFLFFVCIFFGLSSCFKQVAKEESENQEAKIDVEKSCSLIKIIIGIGLPLAIKEYQKEKRIEHIKEVIKAVSEIVELLNQKKELSEVKILNSELDKLNHKFSPFESQAVASAIEILFLFTKEKLKPESIIGKDFYNVFLCFLNSIVEVFEKFDGEKKYGYCKLNLCRD